MLGSRSAMLAALALTLLEPFTATASLRWRVVRAEQRLPMEISARVVFNGDIALSSDERKLLVGGSGRVDLAVLDAETLALEREIDTRDAVDNFYLTRDGRHIVASASFGRVYVRRAGWLRGGVSLLPADDIYILDRRTLELCHRVKVGQNVGSLAELRDGTVLVPAVEGRRITRVDVDTGRVLARLDTRRLDRKFVPTRALVRADDRVGMVTGGAFSLRVGGRGGSRPVGSSVLLFDPLAHDQRNRLTVVRELEHPLDARYLADGRHVLVTDAATDDIVVVDWLSGVVRSRRPVPDRPAYFVEDGESRLVVVHLGARLSALDLATGEVSSLELPSRAYDFERSPCGRFLYLGLRSGVGVVRLADLRLVDVIPTTLAVVAVALDRAGTRLYAVEGEGRYVAPIE